MARRLGFADPGLLVAEGNELFCGCAAPHPLQLLRLSPVAPRIAVAVWRCRSKTRYLWCSGRSLGPARLAAVFRLAKTAG